MAHGRFEEAFEMFGHFDRDVKWTPAILQETIRGYGVPDIDSETLSFMLEEWGVSEFQMTSLDGRNDRSVILDEIEIERGDSYYDERLVGMIEYQDIPICGRRSDMTARFHLVRHGDSDMHIELLDIHVM